MRPALPSLWAELFITPHLACPPPCAGCGARSSRPVCTGCLREARFHLGSRSRRLPDQGLTVHCLGAYWDPGRRPTSIATALHRFKYGGDRAVGHALQWLARSYAAPPDASGYDLVVPVPLTRAKLRSRGLNQAAWIARAIARTLFLPTVPAALARIRDRRAQIGLAGSARRSQAGSEFRAAPAAVSDRRVLLIDDVITTGTTLANCARELRRAGASGVVGVTLLGVAHYHGGDDDEAPD